MVEKAIIIETDNPEFNEVLAGYIYSMVDKFKRMDHKHGDRSVVRAGYAMRDVNDLSDGILSHLMDEVTELKGEMNITDANPLLVMGEAVDVGNMAFLIYWKGRVSK